MDADCKAVFNSVPLRFDIVDRQSVEITREQQVGIFLSARTDDGPRAIYVNEFAIIERILTIAG